MAVTKLVLAFFAFFFTFTLFPNTISSLHETPHESAIGHHYQSRILGHHINLFVAHHGSAEFKTIKDALHAAKTRRLNKLQMINIHIEAGTYKEYLTIRDPKISLIGAGMGKTIITGHKIINHNISSTHATATVTVTGTNESIFIARGITFRNTAGLPHGHGGQNQAVALRSEKVNSAFYHCSFEGYQDTLFADSGIQFYRECTISGSTDFIFGNALAIFQRCTIIIKPSHSNKSIITAQARENPEENTGFIFLNCKFYPSDELRPLIETKKNQIYFGRPWKLFARTIILNSELQGIDHLGWITMDKNSSTDNVEFVEYGNTGDSASTDGRVKWFKVLHSLEEARKYSVKGFWHQFNWLKSANVPFDKEL